MPGADRAHHDAPFRGESHRVNLRGKIGSDSDSMAAAYHSASSPRGKLVAYACACAHRRRALQYGASSSRGQSAALSINKTIKRV